MKKLILIGIIILICCSVFLIIRQNQSHADIADDVYKKTYPVPFGNWVEVWLYTHLETQLLPDYAVNTYSKLIEDKSRFVISVVYKDTKIGREWYQDTFLVQKGTLRLQCASWTVQGYPISLNDFQFDIRKFE